MTQIYVYHVTVNAIFCCFDDVNCNTSIYLYMDYVINIYILVNRTGDEPEEKL